MAKKKLTALLLSAAMMTSALPAIVVTADEPYASRAEVAEMLLTAADDYTPGLTVGDIIKGYEDGETRDSQPITRAESFVMVSRAFGTLPAPVGNDKRLAKTDVAFTGIPDWARTDVENLVQAGILVGTEDGALHGDENVTAEQVEIIIRRIFNLKGSNVKDDFYAASNKEWLDKSQIKPGDMAAGGFNDLAAVNDNRVSQMINEIVAGTHEKGTKEQKVADFYKSAADVDGRNKMGLEPIQPYLDAINNAKTISELFEAQAAYKEKGCGYGILEFSLIADQKDSDNYMMAFVYPSPSFSKEVYAAGGEKVQLYIDYLADFLTLSGSDEAEARVQAQAMYDMEKALSEKQMDRQDSINVDKFYNVYSLADIQKHFPEVDLSAVLKTSGLANTDDRILVMDPGLMEAAAGYFTPENLPLLKTVVKISLLSGISGTLNEDFIEASNDFQNSFYGTEGSKTSDELAALTTQSFMSEYLGELFVEKYFSKEAKDDVTNMVKDFISIYKDRINGLDWMSETTKEKAAKKLDTMKFMIGYPDSWETPMDQVDLTGPSDTQNSYFENVCSIVRSSMAELAERQGKPVDKTRWQMSAYTVNAYYDATANTIVFPAGILQAPFYDIKASREENLGGIGTVIAHEITHAFDNNGAKYDENGNASNWWTEEDYQAFAKLCEQVVEYYDGQEVAPGITTNGTLTLSENIADLGGIACSLAAMEKLENPDYTKFYKNLANIWCMTMTRDYAEQVSYLDYHSANKIRANRMASAFEPFYKVYGVTEGDGMYVAPEDRVAIW